MLGSRYLITNQTSHTQWPPEDPLLDSLVFFLPNPRGHANNVVLLLQSLLYPKLNSL